MKIDNAMQLALLGLNRSLAGVRDTAGQIAGTGQLQAESPAGLAGALVELKTYELQGQASAQVVKTVDEMIGSLFDDKA
ncbi:hypothetical protein TspCOW1_25670 [Thiohalobacter sp. COW1]|uniref:hypothetical protein n=1 Tax=Thiohalobacter sp. COW1 TaxID=2795687 RepID=UPI001914ED8E|nr:hypothetical protein [Thiohalobacter sp. COW1]BCO32464.1 hypothetical protein TspCOW1_25670 [Thiohalobacter sp. COW1]